MMKNSLFLLGSILLLIVGILSCTRTIENADLLDKKWILTEMEDALGEYQPVQEIHIEFSENEASGTSGCNYYWINYSRENDLITFSGLSITEKACTIELNQLENIFINLLVTGESLRLKNTELTIYCENGELEFRMEE
jgi:heat shock protein HslJ